MATKSKKSRATLGSLVNTVDTPATPATPAVLRGVFESLEAYDPSNTKFQPGKYIDSTGKETRSGWVGNAWIQITWYPKGHAKLLKRAEAAKKTTNKSATPKPGKLGGFEYV